MDLSIIIPFYNESDGVRNLYEKLSLLEESLKRKRINYEIILIDDCSKDNTLEMIYKYFGNKKNVNIIRHDKNGNIGSVFKTGLKNAAADYIATFDSDCTYDVFTIEKMFEKAKTENLDIITASPYHHAGGTVNIPGYRLFLSKSVSRIYKILLGSKINTYTAFNRIYNTERIKKIGYKNNGFIFNAEILYKALKKNYKIDEYPTKLMTREFGESKMKLFRVIRDHSRLLFQIILGDI